MKRTKQITGIILSLLLLIGIFPPMPVHASGKVTISVSSSSVNIGDTVTVNAWASGPNGEKAIAKLGFNYDSGKFSFVSCSESNYSGGSGGYVGVVSNSASITLKATAAGSASVSVSGSEGANMDKTAEYGELSAGGTTLTVNNGAGTTTDNQNGENNNGENNGDTENANKSGDNSLASLNISPGTLSPAFQYSTTSYTATVGDDVTSINVDAKPSNSKATVDSVTGHTDLKPGQNTVTIVVKAENGSTATYKIVVTRGGADASAQQEEPKENTEENPEENTEGDSEGITLNGHPFNLAAAIPADIVPQDFTKTTVTCKGQQVEGLKFDKASLLLVYLTTPSTEVKNTLAVYDEASGSFSPFRKVTIGDHYLILLDPPAETGLSSEYTQTTASMGGFENVPVFVTAGAAAANAEGIADTGEAANAEGTADTGEAANAEGTADTGEAANAEGTSAPASVSDFSLVYAVSSFGNMGWYQYDTVEESFQRYIQTESVQEAPQETEDTSVEMQGLQNAYKDLEQQFNKKKEVSRKTTAVMIFIIAVLLIVIANLLLRGRRGGEESEEDLDYEEPKPRVRKRAYKEEEPDEEEPKSGIRRRVHKEDDVWDDDRRKTTKPKRAVSQETRPMVKPEPQPAVKPEPKSQPKPDIDDDFEVIDLEDL